MFVHIGGDVAVDSEVINTVINLETVLPGQKNVTDFIRSEDENNRLQYLTEDIPRSLIVTSDRSYLSSLSASTLKKRMESGNYFDLSE